MPSYTIESEEASITFIGSFNPAIIHPEWLLRHKLISKDDNKGAEIEIVHPEISRFTLEWLDVDISRRKIIIRTNDPSKYSPLRDLMISIFKILEHTPIKQLGMNLIVTYEIDTEENWHKIGDNLAPKEIWEESLPKRVGLGALTVESPRIDELDGKISVSISSLRQEFFGIIVNTNNHVELIVTQEDKEKIYDAPIILTNYWDSALELAKTIGKTTLTKALET